MEKKKNEHKTIRADTLSQMKKRGGLYTRMATITRSAKDADTSRVLDISFASENPYCRWYGDEILACEEPYVNMERFTSGLGTLLFNHDRNAVIGHVEDAYIDDASHTCRAKVRFDEDELAKTIYQKVQSGTLRGVSVGYAVSEYTYLADSKTVSANGRWQGEAYVATKWTPLEISIVSVPADDTVGTDRGWSENEPVIIVQKKGEEKMEKHLDKINVKELMDLLKKTEDEDVRNEIMAEISKRAAGKEEKQDSLSAEKSRNEETKRVIAIMEMGKRFQVDVNELIRNQATVETARQHVLEELSKRNQPIASVTEDESDKFRAAAVDAMVMRTGQAVEKPAPGATDMRGMSLLELARECLERSGQNIKTWDHMELARAALTGADAFPNILADVAHKTLDTAYNAAPVTYPLFTRKGSNVDFKPAHRVRLSEADELLPIPENGQYKYAEMTDTGVTVQVETFGRKFSLTRAAIINDDLSALTAIPTKFGQAAQRGINKKVFETLQAGKAPDGTTLFSQKHNNLIETGTVLSVETLGTASAKMARQLNINQKEVLNIRPKVLLVPPELYVVASQLVSSNVDPAKYNATNNPFFNALTVVQDAFLTDAKAWYLLGDPNLCDTIEVTYLNGVETPYMEQRIGFDVDGIEFKIRHDYAVTILDYRAMLKNTGADR